MSNENSTFTGMEQKYPKCWQETVAVGGGLEQTGQRICTPQMTPLNTGHKEAPTTELWLETLRQTRVGTTLSVVEAWLSSSVLGHTETVLTYKLQVSEIVDAVHLMRESTIKTKYHSFISLCEMIKNDGSSVCSKFPVTSVVLHCRTTEFKQGFAVEVLFVDITKKTEQQY